ncbi:MAG: hypothetical protein ACI85I_001571 [Arenicella sp.]
MASRANLLSREIFQNGKGKFLRTAFKIGFLRTQKWKKKVGKKNREQALEADEK